jgi:hypothetical protein
VNGKWWFPTYQLNTQEIELKSELCNFTKPIPMKNSDPEEKYQFLSSFSYLDTPDSNIFFDSETNTAYFLIEFPYPCVESYLYCFSFETLEWKEIYLGSAIAPVYLKIIGIANSQTWLVCIPKYGLVKNFFLIPFLEPCSQIKPKIKNIWLPVSGVIVNSCVATDSKIWFVFTNPEKGLCKLSTVRVTDNKAKENENENEKENSFDDFLIIRSLKNNLLGKRYSLHLLDCVPTLVDHFAFAESTEKIKDNFMKITDEGKYLFLETNASAVLVHHDTS